MAFSSARDGFKDEMARGGGGQPATDVLVVRANGSDVRCLTDDNAEEGTVTVAWKWSKLAATDARAARAAERRFLGGTRDELAARLR